MNFIRPIDIISIYKPLKISWRSFRQIFKLYYNEWFDQKKISSEATAVRQHGILLLKISVYVFLQYHIHKYK